MLGLELGDAEGDAHGCELSDMGVLCLQLAKATRYALECECNLGEMYDLELGKSEGEAVSQALILLIRMNWLLIFLLLLR